MSFVFLQAPNKSSVPIRKAVPDCKIVGSVVSNEWMEEAGYESVKMRDGQGQWVFLEIYHDLHCLSYLRKVIYNNTNGLITDDSDPFFKYHVRK